MKKMICPKCGNSSNLNAKFCSECGENLSAVTPPMPKKLEKIDTEMMIKDVESMMEDYFKALIAGEEFDDDNYHYFFEGMMQTVYGEGVFKFLNSIDAR